MVCTIFPIKHVKYVLRRARDLKADTKSRGFWRKSFIYAVVLGLGVALLTGCGNSATSGAAQDSTKAQSSQGTAQPGQEVKTEAIPASANISANALEEALKANQGLQLVDVREAREFASGHIKMAINRPLADLEKNLSQISKDKEIVLIDLNGTRASVAWQTLLKNGYSSQKIKVLSGGMMEWRGNVSSVGNNAGGDPAKGGSGEAPKAEVQEVKGGC